MNYLNTPSRFNNNSSKKVLSPTTAHSKKSLSGQSSTNMFQSVLSSIDGIISEAQQKRDTSKMGLDTVYSTNQELLDSLQPEGVDLRM